MSVWNEEAQWDTFLHGLTGRIQRELQRGELPSSLNGVIDAAIRADIRLRTIPAYDDEVRLSSRQERPSPVREKAAGSSMPDPEPMQVGQARISREERICRRSLGLCLYCGEAGHPLHRCPVKGNARE